MSKILGILGGMGPLAGANFLLAVISHTNAATDGDHIHAVMTSRPDIPDRSDFLLGRSEASPLPLLKNEIERLVSLGAELIAMPCNTAHAFYGELSSFSPVPILHMPRASLQTAAEAGMRHIAILATCGTAASGLYPSLAGEYGISCLLPSEKEQAVISSVIHDIKAGKRIESSALYATAAALFGRGCDGILLGCTELSTLSLEAFPERDRVVDSTLALAKAAILACGKTPCDFTPPHICEPRCRLALSERSIKVKDIFALLEGLPHTVFGHAEGEKRHISDIAYHSKNAGKHVLFVCLCGYLSDGHDYAADAYARGSRLFVCEHPLPLPEDATQFIVGSTRIALAHLCAAFFDHPEKKLRLIGVTGTKGKSTVSEMIFHILTRCGIPSGRIGTVGSSVGGVTRPTENTTPESYEIYRLLAEMVEAGAKYAVMEVSSQGVKMERIHGLSFFAAVLTNLTEDHIGEGEHPDFEDYKNAKKAIFRRTEYAVLNADDPIYSELADFTTAKKRSFSLCGEGDMNAADIRPMRRGEDFCVSFTAKGEEEDAPVFVPMPGPVTVSNALAALTVCELCGVPLTQTSSCLGDAHVSGRFEVVQTALSGVTFVIDYAHNGDSLRNALSTLRDYQPRRLICLFGAVGRRTKHRRAEMGFAASELADLSILTSDNPDTEPPLDILSDIEAAMAGANAVLIPDRRDAIEYAVSIAETGDIVLLAGKGHETYQLIDGKKLPFSEKDILQAAAARREVPVP